MKPIEIHKPQEIPKSITVCVFWIPQAGLRPGPGPVLGLRLVPRPGLNPHPGECIRKYSEKQKKSIKSIKINTRKEIHGFF